MADAAGRTIRLSAEPASVPEDVQARVDALVGAGHDGWAQFTSGTIAWVRGATFTTGDGARGVPLAGEWRTGETTSVHLRQRGDGWVWTTAEEVPGNDGPVEDASFLTNLPASLGASRILYRTAWVPQGSDPRVQPLAPKFSRFAGWKE